MKNYKQNEMELKKFAYDIYNELLGKDIPIFLCVGSDKFVCDCLGPMVGEMLVKKYNINAYVYGGLDYNINANNLISAINYIETEHHINPIVLIDATMDNNVGEVVFGNGSFAGMGRVFPVKKIGDYSILGVVGKKTKTFDLNSTKLKIVCDLASFISKGIAMAVFLLNSKRDERRNNLKKVLG